MSQPSSQNERVVNKSFVSIASIFDRFTYTVIVSFFVGFIITQLSLLDHLLEITVLMAEVFVLWVIVDHYLRVCMEASQVLHDDKEWHMSLLNLMDSITLLLIFLVFQLALSVLTVVWEHGNLNTLESIVCIIVIMIFTVSLYQNIKIIFDRENSTRK